MKVLEVATQTEEDRLWSKWLEAGRQGREWRDLAALLTSEVRTEFKVRALTILTEPDLSTLPKGWWNGDRRGNYLYQDWFDPRRFPSNLARWLGERIHSLFLSATFGGSKNKNYQLGNAIRLNDLIPKVLALFPEEGEDEEVAQQLLDDFVINDLVASSGLEECSGYNPFGGALRDPKLPLRWKVAIDQKMRERILAELSGTAKPRQDWEEALQCYASQIEGAIHKKQLGYETELFISQMQFLAGLPGFERFNLKLFNGWQVPFIFQTLDGDELRPVRHKLARQIILGCRKDFQSFAVYCVWSKLAALMIRAEFGGEDQELKTRIDSLVGEANSREAQAAKIRIAQQDKENSLLRQMR